MSDPDPRIPRRLRRWPGLHAVRSRPIDDFDVDTEWRGLQATFETSEERTVVGPWAEDREDADVLGPLRAWSLPGPLPSDAVGVLADVLEPLRRAGISILAYSTHGTDWILVARDHADDAEAAWATAGWTFENPCDSRPRTH